MQIVLVVEDDADLRLMVTELLEEAGHIVVDFSTAAQAKAYCDVPRNEILAVVTDVSMPGEESGFDLAAHVAATRPGTAVVVTSGQHDGLPTGISSRIKFLPKPWTADLLLKTLGLPAP